MSDRIALNTDFPSSIMLFDRFSTKISSAFVLILITNSQVILSPKSLERYDICILLLFSYISILYLTIFAMYINSYDYNALLAVSFSLAESFPCFSIYHRNIKIITCCIYVTYLSILQQCVFFARYVKIDRSRETHLSNMNLRLHP